MSINQLLNSLAKRQRNAAKELDSGCTIRARRLLSRRRDKLMVMFKRSGIWKKKQPCGMLDCATCAIFWRMEIEDLERRLPGLVRVPCEISSAGHPNVSEDLKSPPCKNPVGIAVNTSAYAMQPVFPRGQVSTSSSMSTLTEFTENDSVPKSACSLISSSTEFTEHEDASEISSQHSISETSASVSTSTNPISPYSSVIPISLTPSLLTLSATTTRSSCDLPQSRRLQPAKHKSMLKMSDGSEWLPPTLERVQAYIISQGNFRLARSARKVVVQKANIGSKVAAGYARAIRRVDLRR